MKYLTAVIIALSTCIAYTQSDQPSSRIGWTCGFAGAPTETVIAFNKKFKSERINWIQNQLNSQDAGLQFLAILALEFLDEQGDIELTAEQKLQIKELKKSDKLVAVCSGCTFFVELSMNSLFDPSEYSEFKESAIENFKFYEQ